MKADLGLCPDRWPNLAFTDGGLKRLREVEAFLDGLLAGTEPRGETILQEFLERMAYLADFGGVLSEDDARRRFRVTLGADFAPLSFTLTWEAYDRLLDDYRLAFQGALIWHGGGNDPLCVSLTPQLWGIHT